MSKEYRKSAEENYTDTPESVLRYIVYLQFKLQAVKDSLYTDEELESKFSSYTDVLRAKIQRDRILKALNINE